MGLEFPEGDLFRALPPELPLFEVINRSRKLRGWFPEGLPSEEERWHAKRHAEFTL